MSCMHANNFRHLVRNISGILTFRLTAVADRHSQEEYCTGTGTGNRVPDTGYGTAGFKRTAEHRSVLPARLDIQEPQPGVEGGFQERHRCMRATSRCPSAHAGREPLLRAALSSFIHAYRKNGLYPLFSVQRLGTLQRLGTKLLKDDLRNQALKVATDKNSVQLVLGSLESLT